MEKKLKQKLSRKKKKQLKKEYTQVLIKSGKSKKEIQKSTFSVLKKESTFIITKEKKKSVRKNTFKNRVSVKRLELHALGFERAMQKKGNRNLISDKKIDSVSIADIEKAKSNINFITREKFPFLYETQSFDFYKIYECKNGNRLYFAYQDWTGDLPSFLENVNTYLSYNGESLLSFLEGAIRIPQTGKKGVSGSSSGKPATYRFQCGKQEIISTFHKDTYNYKKKKSKRKKKDKYGHTLDYKQPFQVLKTPNGRNSIDRTTAHNLLAVVNAILYNINELDRQAFYSEFYPAINRVLPEIGKILPKP